jgi:hypothetical protein
VKRIFLTDGSGRWFDVEKAEIFPEAAYWNGANYVSKSTESPWEHQELYKTASGRYILHYWADLQPALESLVMISSVVAAKWLAVNEYGPDELCEEEFAELEM